MYINLNKRGASPEYIVHDARLLPAPPASGMAKIAFSAASTSAWSCVGDTVGDADFVFAAGVDDLTFPALAVGFGVGFGLGFGVAFGVTFGAGAGATTSGAGAGNAAVGVTTVAAGSVAAGAAPGTPLAAGIAAGATAAAPCVAGATAGAANAGATGAAPAVAQGICPGIGTLAGWNCGNGTLPALPGGNCGNPASCVFDGMTTTVVPAPTPDIGGGSSCGGRVIGDGMGSACDAVATPAGVAMTICGAACAGNGGKLSGSNGGSALATTTGGAEGAGAMSGNGDIGPIGASCGETPTTTGGPWATMTTAGCRCNKIGAFTDSPHATCARRPLEPLRVLGAGESTTVQEPIRHMQAAAAAKVKMAKAAELRVIRRDLSDHRRSYVAGVG